MKHLDGADATFLNTETDRTPFAIATCLIVAAPEATAGRKRKAGTAYPTALEQIRARLEERIHLAPMLRQRYKRVPLDLHHPVWIDDPNFDLDYHLREASLPEPGDEAALTTLLGRLMARPFDPERPLWECYVIDGLADGRTAIFIKIHHAAVDGVAGFAAVASLVDLTPEGHEVAPPEEEWRPNPIPSDVALIADAALDLVSQPVRTARAGFNLAKGLVTTLTTGRVEQAKQLLGAAMAPPSPFNANVTGPRYLAFFDLQLAELKAVKNAAGATLHDVVLAMVGGGVRRYLLERGELAEESLVTYMPISLRDNTAQAAGGQAAGGNQTTVAVIALGTDDDDPVSRLRQISVATREGKEQAGDLPPPLILDLASVTGPALGAVLERVAVAGGVTAAFRLAGNLVVSNVAGLPGPLFSLGRQIERIIPIGPVTDGSALNITLLSYGETTSFSVHTDHAAVPDPAPLVEHLMAEWDALRAALL